jgi:hypothetical protein
MADASTARINAPRHARIRIVTGGSKHAPTNAQGVADAPFSYREVIERTVARATRYGYETEVFDVGGLGIGRPFTVDDRGFQETGHFQRITADFHGKGPFKPRLILESLIREPRTCTAWLDGDAVLVGPIDEVAGGYDLGVTVRHPMEYDIPWMKMNRKVIGYVNTGVMFFNPSDRLLRFIEEWAPLAYEVGGSDQLALNQVLALSEAPEPWSTIEAFGLKIRFFPVEIYNFYLFDVTRPFAETKILHFKGGPPRAYYESAIAAYGEGDPGASARAKASR